MEPASAQAFVSPTGQSPDRFGILDMWAIEKGRLDGSGGWASG